MARWYTELGCSADAIRSIREADQEAVRHGHDSLRALYFDALADLSLSNLWREEDHLHRAVSAARQAVDLALPMHDPITLQQARITLCIAALKLGNVERAGREIEQAARYRVPERSLIVLALLAAVSLRRNRAGEARDFFDQLLHEGRTRTGRDTKDFTAWNLVGLAICGKHVGDIEPLDEAVAALSEGRRHVDQPAPGLTLHLRFLLEQLEGSSREPHRFRPVFGVLDGNRAHPS